MLDNEDWDNELPTLIYHSHGAHCSSSRVHHLELMIKNYGEKHGKTLNSYCIPIGDLAEETD